MKLINIEIVEGKVKQFLGDEKKPEHIVTTVRLSYKKSRFNKNLIFKEVYPSGTYTHDGSPKQRFQYFNFIDDVGNQIDNETCRRITNHLDKERVQGNLVLISNTKKDG